MHRMTDIVLVSYTFTLVISSMKLQVSPSQLAPYHTDVEKVVDKSGAVATGKNKCDAPLQVR